MGGSSKKSTIGYEYYLGMHMVFCHGPVDKLISIKVDGRVAWQGDSEGGSIFVNASNLFGGKKREGGIQGTLDFETGHSTQSRNDYLQSQLGSDIPAFRGVVGFVLRKMYLGINPYLKPWAARMQRIHKSQDGATQWYDAKAAIPSGATHLSEGLEYTSLLSPSSVGWKYQTFVNPTDVTPYTALNYDDSEWSEGNAPFGDDASTPHPYTPSGYSGTAATLFPEGTSLVLRKVISVTPSFPVTVLLFHDNHANVLWNGVAATSLGLVDGNPFYNAYTFTPTSSSGVLVITVTDSGSFDGTGGNRAHADLTVFQPAAAPGPIPEYDLNPAHIIRECLTNLDWGMGYQSSDIDDESFMAAADAMYAEGLGISLLWDRQIPIEEFVTEIIRHANAALYVDRSSGKFTLKLIREDYDIGELITLDESNIEKVENYTRSAFGELVNSITVNYWDCLTGKTGSVTVDDPALIQLQGSVIGTTLQYPGFTNNGIATRVAMRNLQALSSPLLSCTIFANREAAVLNVGSVFKFEWPDYHDGYVLMRVTGMAIGDGRNNTIRLNCMQDVFDLPSNAIVSTSDDVWLDPSQPPEPPAYRVAVEAPYYELVQRVGQVNVNNQLDAAPDMGYLLATCGAPNGAINATISVDSGAGYVQSKTVDFAPYGILSSDVNYSDTDFPLTSIDNISDVRIGSHAQIGSELVRIDVVNSASVTVGRGVLDTVPAVHAAGDLLIAWDDFAEGDEIEYSDGESVDVKLLPVSGSGVLTEADVSYNTVAFDGRALRPYPPGKFKINTVAYPETILGSDALSVSWSHRDRLQQTSGVFEDTTYGNIGPEGGTTYNIRVYGETGTLIKTSTGISGTSFNYTLADEIDDSDILVSEGYAAKQPNAVSGLNRWFKADAITGKTDGQTISSWIDSSANALHATQATGANQPTYKTGIINGKPVVRFAGSHWLSTAAFLNASNSVGHVFVISKNSVNATGGQISTRNPPTHPVPFVGQGWSMRYQSATSNIVYVVGGSVVSGPGGTLTCQDKFNIFEMLRSSSQFQNGVDSILNSPTVWSGYTPNEFPFVYIGCEQEGTSSFLTGDIAEIIVYDNTLSASDRGGIIQYLNEKYFGYSPAGSRQNGKLRIELESQRSSLVSYQIHDFVTKRTGYGFNYGEYYGGG